MSGKTDDDRKFVAAMRLRLETWATDAEATARAMRVVERFWPLVPPDADCVEYDRWRCPEWRCSVFVNIRDVYVATVNLVAGVSVKIPVTQLGVATTEQEMNGLVAAAVRTKRAQVKSRAKRLQLVFDKLLYRLDETRWDRGTPPMFGDMRPQLADKAVFWRGLARELDAVRMLVHAVSPLVARHRFPFWFGTEPDSVFLRSKDRNKTRLSHVYSLFRGRPANLSMLLGLVFERWITAAEQRPSKKARLAASANIVQLLRPYDPDYVHLYVFARANTARAKRRLRPTLPPELVHFIITEFIAIQK